MAKFKKRDLVKEKRAPYAFGVVLDISIPYYPLVNFGDLVYHVHETRLDLLDRPILPPELLTEPSVPTETGPAPGTLEHWRWEKAADVLAAMASDPSRNGSHEAYAQDAVKFIDCLIAELKGGKP